MKIQLVFTIMLVLLASGLAKAEEVPMINKAGEISMVEKPEILRLLSEEETMALDNPGQEIPIKSHITGNKRVDFFHLAPIKEYSEVFVFEDGKIQTIPKIGAIDGQPIFAIYVVFYLIAIMIMAISNLFMARGDKEGATAFVAFVASVATAFVAFVASVATASVAVVAVAFAVAAVAVVAVDNNTKAYCMFSLVFYVFIIVAMLI